MNSKDLKTYLDLRIHYLEHLLNDKRIQNIGYQKAASQKEAFEEIRELVRQRKEK